MGIREGRAWDRIQEGLLRGILYGGVAGAILGLIIGAIVFHGLGAILTSMLAGVIGAGGLGAFWGVLSGLDVAELTSEEHGRRLPRDG